MKHRWIFEWIAWIPARGGSQRNKGSYVGRSCPPTPLFLCFPYITSNKHTKREKRYSHADNRAPRSNTTIDRGEGVGVGLYLPQAWISSRRPHHPRLSLSVGPR